MLEIVLLFSIPVLYAIANLADKYLVSEGDEEDSDPGALLALSGTIAGLFAVPIGVFALLTGASFGGLADIIMLVGIGFLYYAAIWIYLDMLKVEETSNVVSWYQTVPLFGLIGALIVLGEYPEWYHILAIIFLVLGSFLLSWRDGEMKKTVMFWMTVAALFVAAYDVLFANYGRTIDEVAAISLMLAGKVVAGYSLLLLDKKARKGFWIGLTTKLKAQFISESVSTMADIAMYASILLMPLVLAQGAAALQPLFVLIGAVVMGAIFPQVSEEGEGEDFRKKVIAITLMIMGGILLT